MFFFIFRSGAKLIDVTDVHFQVNEDKTYIFGILKKCFGLELTLLKLYYLLTLSDDTAFWSFGATPDL